MASAVTATYALNVTGGSVQATTGNFSSAMFIGGALGVQGALSVTGTTTLSGGATVNGIATFTGTSLVTSGIPIVYDSSNVSVGNVVTTIDTFALATYRSAKYVLTISNSGNTAYQSTEVLVIHDGTTPYLQDVSVFTGAAPIMTFTTIISTGNVILQGTGTATGNTVKVQRIYTTV